MKPLFEHVEGTGLDVGFVCQGWPPDAGGVESHCEDLARALATRGHRVHVLCLDYAEGLAPYSVRTSMQAGVELRRLAYRYHDQRALADTARNARMEDALAAWLAETPCDLVHVHHLTGFGLGALRAIHELGAPLVMTLHDYWALCPRGQLLRHPASLRAGEARLCARPEPGNCAPCIAHTWPHLLPGEARGPQGEPVASSEQACELRTRFALEMLRQPQRLFTPSAAAREVYARAGLEPERIQVVENGVECAQLRERTQAERAAQPRTDGELRVGFLGSCLPSKGPLELAQALLALPRPELVLELHGALPPYHGDSSYVDALRALAAREPRIRLRGPYTREQLPRILAGLDLVAAPSLWPEVFGLTVREARAAGVPVLVSDAGDLPAVAEGGRAGLVARAGDAAEWSAALERFAADPGLRARLAAHASQPRGTRAMMLELERAYVEVIAEVTGRTPALVHALEPPQGAPSAAAAASASAPSPPAAARAPESAPPARTGLWKRLFGG